MIEGLPQNQGLLDEVLGLGFITFYMLELDYVTILFLNVKHNREIDCN